MPAKRALLLALPKSARGEGSGLGCPPRFAGRPDGILPVERDPSLGVDDAGALVTVGENRGQCDGVEAGGVQRAVPGSGRAMRIMLSRNSPYAGRQCLCSFPD